jgi:carbamoyltransferase
MIICGLKLTHDGAVALIDEGRLVFSTEMEKLLNNPRYTDIKDTGLIAQLLGSYGYAAGDVTHFAVDGWGGYDQAALAIQPRLGIGASVNTLAADNLGSAYKLDIAQYHERTLHHNVLEEWAFEGLRIGRQHYPYVSLLHVTGHIASAYCTSPFAARGQSAYVLVWDGGMYPRLYYVDAPRGKVENLGPLFLLIGNCYSIFAQHFGPFKVGGNFAKDSLSVAGKVMAYIALGEVRGELLSTFHYIYESACDAPMGFANGFANEFKRRIQGQGYSDEDILCTFHAYLEDLLVEKLAKKVARFPHESRNICLAGGCALNIKWNSAVRNSGVFREVWVPPFPNDSGSAIGAACAAMINKTGRLALDWNVYSGPAVLSHEPGGDWTTTGCSLETLARLLHETNEPVVMLNGRAELGPRALGNRSILAAPTSPYMKDLLNLVKKRESYRPVSPICLEELAPVIFDPGTPDPYMLFDHYVREGWAEKIPAVCHLDGTARLQTVNPAQNGVIAELLGHYYRLSGIPLLCNTSANLNGRGFFPDVHSAAAWNEVNYVWCRNTLYSRRPLLPLKEKVESLKAVV